MSGNTSRKLTRDDRAALKFLYGSASHAFVGLTPIRKARYVSNIFANGLPLPVFRWTPGPDANYIVEFSPSTTFEKRISITTGPYPFYEMTPAVERKLSKLSPIDKVFWRVRSGGTVTAARPFRFI
jgi:hypothetical protein